MNRLDASSMVYILTGVRNYMEAIMMVENCAHRTVGLIAEGALCLSDFSLG